LTLRAFEEALRLYPPAWLIARDSVHEDVVMGYRVPGGCIVLVSVYGLHRSPDLWDNPETFDPDRFLPERSAGRERYAYLPFGVGQRQCIGNTFALTEGHLILATLLQRYRFESLPGDGVATEPLITLRPRGGLLLRVTPA
ncbi:MAG TPA: cytochrome P450, partial [Myxococcaceae bacterium]|nr:cytochrome P450 [Myxococcaceae bacterium]